MLTIGVGLLILAGIGFLIRQRNESSARSGNKSSEQSTPSNTVQGTNTTSAIESSSQDVLRETPFAPLRPVSPWLAAPANPVRVSVQNTSDRGRSERFTPGGGQLTLSAKDGMRVTLTLPADVLLSSQELKMELVEVREAPFSGGILAAVRITPETVVLRRHATLIFESRQPIEETQPLSGIAVRDGGELHLVRADRSADPKLRGRARVELPLVRLGAYGVARTSAEEITAALQHEPTEYLARLEQRVARAFTPIAAKARLGRTWSVVPTLYAQGGIFPVDDLMNGLETSFNEVVVKHFENIPNKGCETYPAVYAMGVYFSWSALANLLLPFRPVPTADPDVLELQARLREQRRTKLREHGYSDDNIAFIDGMFEKYRDRIEELDAKADGLIDAALTRQFATAYRCCLSVGTKVQYLDVMVETMRVAALRDITLDPDPMTKAMECSCRVNVGTAWATGGDALPASGTITHSETFEGKKVEQTANRTVTNSTSMTYKQTLVLVQNRGNKRYGATYDVSGSMRIESERWDQYPCGRQGDAVKRSGSGRDDGSQVVTIEPVPNSTNQYRIVYFPQSVRVPGIETTHHEDRPCSVFARNRDSSKEVILGVNSVPGEVVIETEADSANPTELRGSKDFTIDQSGDRLSGVYGKPRSSKVQWNLQLCPK